MLARSTAAFCMCEKNDRRLCGPAVGSYMSVNSTEVSRTGTLYIVISSLTGTLKRQ